jgi:FkbM family methyltransferase
MDHNQLSRAQQRTEEQIVQEMFWAYLGRPADQQAVRFYAELLRSGTDPQQIEREVAESPESMERARHGVRRPTVKRVWPLASDIVRLRQREPAQPERLDDLEETVARLDWRQAALIEQVEVFAEQVELLRKSFDALALTSASDDRRRGQEAAMFQQSVSAVLSRLDMVLDRQVFPCGETTVIRWKDWLFGMPASEWMLASGMALSGHSEKGLIEFIRATLTAGMSFVDVGASFGTVFMPAAARVAPGGWAEAWEPDPLSFHFLERNVLLNGHENDSWVRVRPEAAGASDGPASLAVGRLTRTHNSFWLTENEAGDHVNVPVRRLDSVYARPISLLKIDVEGAEWDVLEGARGLLDQRLIGIIALEFRPASLLRAGRDPREFLAMLESLGGRISIIDAVSGVLHPYDRQAVAAASSLNLAVQLL